MKKLRPIPLSLLLLLAACDGSSPTAAGARLEFASEQVEGARAVLTPRFDAGAGEITVSGAVGTPCIGQELRADLEGAGPGIVLTLTAVFDRPCLTAIGYRAYTARITNLPEGLYRVRVLYGLSERGHPLEAGESRIRVR